MIQRILHPLKDGVINMVLVIGILSHITIILIGKTVVILDYVLILQLRLLNIIVGNCLIINLFIQLYYKPHMNSVKD